MDLKQKIKCFIGWHNLESTDDEFIMYCNKCKKYFAVNYDMTYGETIIEKEINHTPDEIAKKYRISRIAIRELVESGISINEKTKLKRIYTQIIKIEKEAEER